MNFYKSIKKNFHFKKTVILYKYVYFHIYAWLQKFQMYLLILFLIKRRSIIYRNIPNVTNYHICTNYADSLLQFVNRKFFSDIFSICFKDESYKILKPSFFWPHLQCLVFSAKKQIISGTMPNASCDLYLCLRKYTNI